VEQNPVLTYHQSSGLMNAPDGAFVALGWAGNDSNPHANPTHIAGKNNPNVESVRCIGPLPKGLYRVGHWEDMHAGLGPIVAHLEQIEGETFGRSGFYFHGPAQNVMAYGQESEGCIVVPRAGRLKVREQAPEGSVIEVVV
jgi:hypothetical protein